jgi:hypothetical protein
VNEYVDLFGFPLNTLGVQKEKKKEKKGKREKKKGIEHNSLQLVEGS